MDFEAGTPLRIKIIKIWQLESTNAIKQCRYYGSKSQIHRAHQSHPNMSRKPPSDTFTRFTSTIPSTSSQTQSQPSPSFTSQTQFPQETAAQKVARLRAAHIKKRQAEFSTSDRLLSSGRRFADIAHRATTYTLLAFSGVAVIVAGYGFVSLVSHNRTQKRAWIEHQMDRLEAARAAFLQGTADAEQLHLLEQERAGEEIHKKYEEDKKRRKEESWTRKLTGLFSKGDMGKNSEELTLTERAEKLKDQERAFERQLEERTMRPAAVQESGIAGVGLDEKGRPVPVGKMVEMPVSQPRRGGVLDEMADNLTTDVQRTGSSLWSKVFGR